MKAGRTLQDLAIEIERQAATKRDYVAATGQGVNFRTVERDGAQVPVLALRNTADFPVTDTAHAQIAEHVKIPKQYYDRMRREDPELLATNVDRWFTKYPAARMVRTLDGNARGFLSDKFQCLDNHDFANAALPILLKRKLTVMSCEITERRLYIKAVDQALFKDVPVGHKMGDGSHTIFATNAPAVILANSEIGFGRLVIETGVYTQACTNLALFSASGMKRTHVGAKHALLDAAGVTDLENVMSAATKKKSLEALWLQVHDVIASAFDENIVRKRAEQFEAAAGRRIERKVEEVVEVAAVRFDLNDGERESVLKHLIEGGSLSQFGLSAAITRAAQDVESYDRATELEYAGGKVIELNRTEWAQLAAAA